MREAVARFELGMQEWSKSTDKRISQLFKIKNNILEV